MRGIRQLPVLIVAGLALAGMGTSGAVPDGATAARAGGTQAVTLTALAIAGPTAVLENATAAYTATASFSDGSSRNVTSAASWTENSPVATISGGLLTTEEATTSGATVVIGASYTSAGVTKSAALEATISNVPNP
jgi:hypothetical protein